MPRAKWIRARSTDGNQSASDVGASSQSAEQLLLRGVLIGLNKEGTDDGSEDADGSQSHGQSHTGRSRKPADDSQSSGRQTSARIGLVQVSAHTGNVADVIANVIGDNSGVTRVILRDASLYLTNQVSADVGSLGEDTAANTGKQSHSGSAHTEGQP